MTELTRQVVAIARPGLAWAVHFIAIYALISGACAARALFGYAFLLIAGGMATVICAGLCLWSVAAPPAGADLKGAAFWSGLIFAMAILANASALFFFQSCGG
ncbi:MAG: hypothetical protein VX874_03265 [Pseudomonadota bacterium]|nr:hypothetical protein [Pseudomonadota bacterium]